MKIGIVGFGTVGKTIYHGFTSRDHEVYMNDLLGVIPVYQADYLLKAEMVARCEVIFICVDTPTNKRGCDLSKVYQVFNDLHFEIAKQSKEDESIMPIIVVKSTVIPGTTDSLSKMYPYVCYNPEFLRANDALDDFLHPDRIIIGSGSTRVKDIMTELYKEWDTNHFLYTSFKEAELIKYMSNAFLVMKVAFSQEVNHISQMLGIDPNKVYEGLITDIRVNPSHLYPQLGPIRTSSPCLPKDMKALIIQLDESGYDSHLLKSAYAKGVADIRMGVKFHVEEKE